MVESMQHAVAEGHGIDFYPATSFEAFADKLVEVVAMDDDYVWIHDYHLLVRACFGKPPVHTEADNMSTWRACTDAYPLSELWCTIVGGPAAPATCNKW